MLSLRPLEKLKPKQRFGLSFGAFGKTLFNSRAKGDAGDPKANADEAAKLAQAHALDHHADDHDWMGEEPASRMSVWMMLFFTTKMPFVIFTTLICLFTYAYHLTPWLPWLVAFLFVDFALIATYAPSSSDDNHDRQQTLFSVLPMLNCVIAVCLGIFCGILNYENIEAWVGMSFLNEYTDVLPEADPLTVIDGGILHFAAGSKVETAAAAGYYAWPNTYCAAPIVGGGGLGFNNSLVGFWAVGMGCCESRKDFQCNDAGNHAAQSGIIKNPKRLLNFFFGQDTQEHYMKAIRMAAAANDISLPEKPMALAWHEDPAGVGIISWWIATIAICFLTLIALVSCCSLQAVLTHARLMSS